MADIVDGTPAKKAKAATKAKKTKVAPTHPKISEMVTAAISTLKERGGSSVHAIKKYIGATYKVDAEKLSPFIKKYLKSAVVSGGLVQTKGKGATGSFRIGGTSTTVKKTKPAAAKPKKPAVKATKTKKPKAATPKKKVAKPKKATPKKPKSSPAKKAKPAATKKKPAVKKPKVVKLAATKAKKPKATPKKAAAKKSKK